MSSSNSSCCGCAKPNSLVNGLQNQTLDVLNRSAYLAAPYASGPPLNNITPSLQVVAGPLAGCGGGVFSTPLAPVATVGPIGPAPIPVSPVGPVSPVSMGPVSPVSMGPSLSVAQPYMQQQYNNCNNANTSGNGPVVSPYTSANTSAIPGAPVQGTASLNKFNQHQQDTTPIVGVAPSTKNLMKATGESDTRLGSTNSCEDNTFSDAVPQQFAYGAPFAAGPFASAPFAATPFASAPLAAAPFASPAVLATPTFLGGVANVGVAPGIAFGNECGVGYGLNTPLAVQGPLAPQTTVLGSTYMERFAYQPFYSGANFSEPAAVMNSANPQYPGYIMMARSWNGTPQIIISKPDQFGCPNFETISPFEDHGVNCECERCLVYTISFCEYNCINGFGSETPNNVLTTNALGMNTSVIPVKDFYFILYPIIGSNAGTSPVQCLNDNGYAVGVNNKIARNIVMYKGCQYNVIFNYDKEVWPTGSPTPPSSSIRLFFTRDPCGGTGCNTVCAASLVVPGFPVTGISFGAKITFTPTREAFPDCITTIYYQICDGNTPLKFSGGPITIL